MIVPARLSAPVIGRGALLLVVALAVPAVLSGVWSATLTLALIYGMWGLSVVVLTGYVGQLSLMPATFIGIGAFASADFMSRMATPFWAAVPLAAMATVPAAVLIGMIALRVRGLYLAIMTLVFADVFEQGLFRQSWFTGEGGVVKAARPHLGSIDFSGDKAYYLLVLTVTAAALWAIYGLSRSKTGRACYAVRDNEAAAQAWGINVAKYKLIAFALSGFIAGLGGGLYASWLESVSAGGQRPEFGLEKSLTILFFTIVGGVRSMWGPIVGALIWVVLVQRLLAGSANGVSIALAAFGVLVLATMRWRPRGLTSLGDLLPGRRLPMSEAAIPDEVPV